MMTLEQRNRLRKWCAIALVVAVGLSLVLRYRLTPTAEVLLHTQISNQASDAINRAIGEVLAEDGIDYDRLVTMEKNLDGTVTAVKTNVGEINRLKTVILQRVDMHLSSLSMEQLSVPLGNVLLPELFSGRGPRLPVRVLAIRSSDAEFHSAFSAAGINQTLHQILIEIQVTITIMTLHGTQTVETNAQVVAAETVIVGMVPTTYFGTEDNS